MSYFALVLDAHIITSQETQQRSVARSSSSEILWRVMNPIFFSYCTDCCLSSRISWVLVDWFTRTYVHVLLHAGACNDAQFACFARAVRSTRERYCMHLSVWNDIPNSKGTQNMEQLVVDGSFCFSYMKRTGITIKACLLMCVFSLNSHLEWEDDKQSLLVWIYYSS